MTELGINFSHIRAKSLTVLNPIRRVDERIMDDADLAGPLLFIICFGIFLLFVSPKLLHDNVIPTSLHVVGQAAVWIYLRNGLVGLCVHIRPSERHVRKRYRRIPRCLCSRVLPPTDGWRWCAQRHGDTRVGLSRAVSPKLLIFSITAVCWATCCQRYPFYGAHGLHRIFS